MSDTPTFSDYYDAKHAILYAHPTGPTTFGKCSVYGCTNHARGSALCGHHAEEKLASVVGAELASEYHAAIDLLRKIESAMEDKITK